MRILATVFSVSLLVGCGNDVTKEESVQQIFDGFQPTITKIIETGLEAKDASTSGANITPVTTSGVEQGTMTIGGSIAQSGSQNQNFNLWVQLDDDYSDTEGLAFNTDNTDDTTKLQFGLQIQSQPADNLMTGTLAGALEVSGDVDGTAIFDLRFTTDLDDDDANPVVICSKVVGTVEADGATVDLDFISPEDTTALDQTQIDKCDAYAP